MCDNLGTVHRNSSAPQLSQLAKADLTSGTVTKQKLPDIPLLQLSRCDASRASHTELTGEYVAEHTGMYGTCTNRTSRASTESMDSSESRATHGTYGHGEASMLNDNEASPIDLQKTWLDAEEREDGTACPYRAREQCLQSRGPTTTQTQPPISMCDELPRGRPLCEKSKPFWQSHPSSPRASPRCAISPSTSTTASASFDVWPNCASAEHCTPAASSAAVMSLTRDASMRDELPRGKPLREKSKPFWDSHSASPRTSPRASPRASLSPHGWPPRGSASPSRDSSVCNNLAASASSAGSSTSSHGLAPISASARASPCASSSSSCNPLSESATTIAHPDTNCLIGSESEGPPSKFAPGLNEVQRCDHDYKCHTVQTQQVCAIEVVTPGSLGNLAPTLKPHWKRPRYCVTQEHTICGEDSLSDGERTDAGLTV
eukprot:CAMPEP_0119329966 /NCGR_PEP_ID=MMETSP1333-20130426/77172_1 /TAXON_ID=418940 /ORGANISM="Scyphosphaera apsteinii, Strain RCC1455" /LENGTH=431 /DNA_ID=CAMNT_0007339227 /DNA_START=335 /DNA_END=1630 /DNA_ORIENTATION=+